MAKATPSIQADDLVAIVKNNLRFCPDKGIIRIPSKVEANLLLRESEWLVLVGFHYFMRYPDIRYILRNKRVKPGALLYLRKTGRMVERMRIVHS